jgi:hypothetical protein
MKRRRAAISVHSLSLLAREAVIGATEANDLSIRRLMKRRSLGEDGLQNCLLPLEGHE